MIRCEQHKAVISAIKDGVPSAFGVYLFYGKDKNLLYVGKSVNLRQRMLGYFRQRYDDIDPRIGQMILSIRGFDYVTTETELEALLLENDLIKEKLPEYNTRQKEHGEYRYLLLTNDDYPTLKMVSTPRDGHSRAVFGPFRDRYFVEDLLDIIHKYLRLRTCTDSVPHRKDLEFEIGHCAGPCRQKISVEDYMNIVTDVAGFLDGDETLVIDRIGEEMSAAVSQRFYENAGALKDKIDFCRRFCARQRFIRRFRKEKLTVVENSDKKSAHVFVKGRQKTSRERNPELEDDPRLILDRANIVYGWINNNKNTCEYHFETPGR